MNLLLFTLTMNIISISIFKCYLHIHIFILGPNLLDVPV